MSVWNQFEGCEMVFVPHMFKMSDGIPRCDAGWQKLPARFQDRIDHYDAELWFNPTGERGRSVKFFRDACFDNENENYMMWSHVSANIGAVIIRPLRSIVIDFEKALDGPFIKFTLGTADFTFSTPFLKSENVYAGDLIKACWTIAEEVNSATRHNKWIVSHVGRIFEPHELVHKGTRHKNKRTARDPEDDPRQLKITRFFGSGRGSGSSI